MTRTPGSTAHEPDSARMLPPSLCDDPPRRRMRLKEPQVGMNDNRMTPQIMAKAYSQKEIAGCDGHHRFLNVECVSSY